MSTNALQAATSCSCLRCDMNEDDYRHGTTNGYGNLKCRCDRCSAAQAKFYQLEKAKKHALRESGLMPEAAHGRPVGYQVYGCECEPCLEHRRLKGRGGRPRQGAVLYAMDSVDGPLVVLRAVERNKKIRAEFADACEKKGVDPAVGLTRAEITRFAERFDVTPETIIDIVTNRNAEIPRVEIDAGLLARAAEKAADGDPLARRLVHVVSRHLSGEAQASIATDLEISRERVRQIIDQVAVSGPGIRPTGRPRSKAHAAAERAVEVLRRDGMVTVPLTLRGLMSATFLRTGEYRSMRVGGDRALFMTAQRVETLAHLAEKVGEDESC